MSWSPRIRRRFARAVIATSVVAAGLPVAAALPAAPASAAAPTELFFSEYIEGSSNNKALEIYNGTGAPIDLAAGGYQVQMYYNGATTAGLTITLTGTVAAGDVYVARAGIGHRRDPGPGRPDQRGGLVQRRRRRGPGQGAASPSTASARSASTPARSGAPVSISTARQHPPAQGHGVRR